MESELARAFASVTGVEVRQRIISDTDLRGKTSVGPEDDVAKSVHLSRSFGLRQQPMSITAGRRSLPRIMVRRVRALTIAGDASRPLYVWADALSVGGLAG